MRQQYVHELFQEVATAYPSLAAIVMQDETLSYGDLETWSNNIAHRLLAAGARKGSIAYVAASSSVVMVASILACLKLGVVFVPIDAHTPPARLRLMASEVNPDFVLAEQSLGSAVSAVISPSVPVITIGGGDGEGRLAARLQSQGLLSSVRAAEHSSEPDDFCYVYFTSGSTGKPKAIAGRLKAIDHFVRWESSEFGVTRGTVVSQLASPVFDAFLRDVFTPLCFGGTMRVPDSRELVLDAGRLVRWIDESKIELMHSVPSIFRTILAEPLTGSEFQSLRTIALAGEALLASDARRWRDLFGDRIRLVNLYGPSETTMVKLFHTARQQDLERHTIPIGKAIPGARVLVLDEAQRPTAEGAVGEIVIRTPYRTLGYFGRPDLTNEVFVCNPLGEDPNDLVYKTGDLGRMLEDGSIEFLGRRDNQVKVRGVRIEISEIENAILETGLAAEAVVVTRTDKLGNDYLCSYLVSTNGSVRDEIRIRLSEILPEMMVPSVLLEVESLPRTPTGKIDRNALPDPEVVLSKNPGFVGPRTPMEAEVASLFADVLSLEKVGVFDDFFQLGGHSLLAMTLLSNLISRFDVDLPLASLFEQPTVAEITPVILQLQAEGRMRSSDGFEVSASLGGDLEQRVAAMTDEEVDALLSDILVEKSAGAKS